jgi:hypothetical protein
MQRIPPDQEAGIRPLAFDPETLPYVHYVPKKTVDEVTGIEGVIYEKKF